jgi:hypothetical protein
MLLLIYFAGFTALLIKPGLKGSDVDQSFMLIVQEHFAPWVLGLVSAATTSVECSNRNSGWTGILDCVCGHRHEYTRWGEFWPGSADREYGRLAGDRCGAESGGNQDRKPIAE